MSTCQGHLYNCRDVVGTCTKQANVQNISWWNPKPTQKYARFGLYAFRDDMDDRSKNLQICLQRCFFRKCTNRRMYITLHEIIRTLDKCDRFEQKQACGCILTNPPHVTPLRPGSIFIDGFSRAIYQKIADFNSYPLRYQF